MDTYQTIKEMLNRSDSLESLFKAKMLTENDNSKFNEFIDLLIANGWHRKKFYDVSLYINHNEGLSDEEQEVFSNFMDGLTGFCAKECIMRFPNEPENEKEFLEYVYSNKWK